MKSQKSNRTFKPSSVVSTFHCVAPVFPPFYSMACLLSVIGCVPLLRLTWSTLPCLSIASANTPASHHFIGLQHISTCSQSRSSGTSVSFTPSKLAYMHRWKTYQAFSEHITCCLVSVVNAPRKLELKSSLSFKQDMRLCWVTYGFSLTSG